MQLPKRKPGKYSQIPSDTIMSQQKYEELTRELQKLKAKHPHAASEVRRLAEMGDFSENVEYQLAKGRLRGINNAMLKLEYQINHAEVIKPTQRNTVEIGSTVTVLSEKGERVYTILGSSEVNPSRGVISHLSPLGSALLGHKKKDDVTVDGAGVFKIIDIQ